MKLRDIDRTKLMIHIMFTIVMGILALLVYWALRPYEVYYNVQQPYDVLNSEPIKNGDAVLVRQVYCKGTDSPAKITIILEDGYYETLRLIESRVEPGCYDRTSQSAVIPPTAHPGRYRLRYRFEVRVNPIRTETYVIVTDYFEVIEP